MGKNIDFKTHSPVNEKEKAVVISSARSVFRDGFIVSAPDTESWYEKNVAALVTKGGNSFGSSYLRITLDPYEQTSEYKLTSKETFRFPLYPIFGLSISQRILGQEIFAGIVGSFDDDVETSVEDRTIYTTEVADIAISGTITIATNIATVNTASPHGLNGGDRVCLYGNAENRLNVGPVVVTVVTATQFTVPCTLTNGTYTAGGSIHFAEPNRYAKNYVGILAESTSSTTLSFVARRNGAKFRSLAVTAPTTVATQSNTSPYTDAFNAAGQHELQAKMSEIIYVGRTPDGAGTPSGNSRFSQGIPDEDSCYRIQVRARNLPNISRPVANIVTAAKTGTAVATITTDRAHGLVTGQFVQIYGILDQTNFPNLTTAAAVTVTDATHFTITIGGAVTANSTGGIVAINNGSVTLPGAINLAIVSIVQTGGILTVTMNTTASGLLPGEYAYLAGMTGAAAAYNGSYKVLRLNTSTFELESTKADIGSTGTGGAIIKQTDIRLHYIGMIDSTRIMVEMAQSNGLSDGFKSIPVRLIDGTITTLTTLTGSSIAHDAVDSGSPHKIGGKAMAADPTPVAGADRADLYVDTVGKIVNTPLAPRNLVGQGNITLSTTTETTVIAALGASVFTDISTIIVANTSATGVRVDFRDATAGTVRHSVWVPANNTIECNFDDVPLKQTAAANGPWTAQLSAAVTDVRITMVGPGRKA